MTMEAIAVTIVFVGILYILVTIAIGAEMENFLNAGSFSFFLPSAWRKTKVFNWFGAIFITILIHIVFLPWAIWFWFWKALTIGGNK